MYEAKNGSTRRSDEQNDAGALLASNAGHARRGIPSLDGMRALAVSTVILSHFSGWSRLPRHGALHLLLTLLGQGGLGVSVFFVISGFLITMLLLHEKEARGKVDIRQFYFRRAFRIFPAFYVYLFSAALVAWLAHRPMSVAALGTAAVYVSDYYPYAWIHPPMQAWYVAHTWSLSIEEQFYLVWPILVGWLPQRRMIALCVAVLFITPWLRLITVATMPIYATVDQWYRLFHTTADVLALGCLLALVVKKDSLRRRLELLFHPAILVAACVYLAGSGALFTHAPQWFTALFGISFTNISIALLLAYVVLRPHTAFGKLLNAKLLRHVGLISYSLYLWQQLFLGPYWAPSTLWNLLAIVVCAELSFWLIEQPALKMRSRLGHRLFARAAARNAAG